MQNGLQLNGRKDHHPLHLYEATYRKLLALECMHAVRFDLVHNLMRTIHG
jgi:hypothetical protein